MNALFQRMIGCSIISALMLEYGVTVKSTDVGLTWETHFKSKKAFEVSHEYKKSYQSL